MMQRVMTDKRIPTGGVSKRPRSLETYTEKKNSTEVKHCFYISSHSCGLI